MGHKHDHGTLLAAAVEFVEANGLSRFSFGRLAKHVGIADRTIVYYFPTKDQLVTEVLEAISGRLLAQLAQALGEQPLPRIELLKAAWPVLTSPESEPTFRVFLELGGLAASRIEPYAAITREIFLGWHAWLATLVAASTSSRRSNDAAVLIAQIDGLMLMRMAGDPGMAQQAYRQFVKQ
ncbi:MAG TPA: TetR/AcrR family transcriptional regulator [Actinobacteria bacterium]|nr:TetR/AcrR family transcriptional regulator [Actinomycetota bacterium]